MRSAHAATCLSEATEDDARGNAIDRADYRARQKMASLLRQHQDAVERLAEVPGLGVDSAQQIIAEVDLVDPARRSPLPGTRSSGEQTSKGTARMIGQLRNLGYRIEPPQLQNLSSA